LRPLRTASHLHRPVGREIEGAAGGAVRIVFVGVENVGGGLDGAAVGVDEVHRVAQGLDGVGVVVLRGGLVLIGLFPIVQGRLGGGGIGGQEIVERVAFGEGDDGGGVGFERAAVFAKIFLTNEISGAAGRIVLVSVAGGFLNHAEGGEERGEGIVFVLGGDGGGFFGIDDVLAEIVIGVIGGGLDIAVEGGDDGGFDAGEKGGVVIGVLGGGEHVARGLDVVEQPLVNIAADGVGALGFGGGRWGSGVGSRSHSYFSWWWCFRYIMGC